MRPAGMPVQRRYEALRRGQWALGDRPHGQWQGHGRGRRSGASALLRRDHPRRGAGAYPRLHPGREIDALERSLVWIVGERLERARGRRARLRCARSIGRTEASIAHVPPSRMKPWRRVPKRRGSSAPRRRSALVGGIRRPPTNLQRLTVPTASYTSLVDRHARRRVSRGFLAPPDDDRDEGTSRRTCPAAPVLASSSTKALQALVHRRHPRLDRGCRPTGYPDDHRRNWVPARWLNDGFIAGSLELIRRAPDGGSPGLGPIAGLGARDVLPELPFLYRSSSSPTGAGTRVHSGPSSVSSTWWRGRTSGIHPGLEVQPARRLWP